MAFARPSRRGYPSYGGLCLEFTGPIVMNPVRQGFSRTLRLTNAREFNRVFRAATVRERAGTLRMSAVANRMHTARIGLVVGKRALPRAHERNRAKRVIREYFRRCRGDLPAMDIVIQVTGDASSAAYRAALAVLLAQLPSVDEEPFEKVSQ